MGQALFVPFVKSKIAISKLAAMTSTEPMTVFTPRGSPRIATPTTTPVIGSKVLRMDVRPLPMRKALFWKRNTAPVETSKENNTHNPHPNRDDGRVRELVAMHMIKDTTVLIVTI